MWSSETKLSCIKTEIIIIIIIIITTILQGRLAYVSSWKFVLPDAENVDLLRELRSLVVNVIHVDYHQCRAGP